MQQYGTNSHGSYIILSTCFIWLGYRIFNIFPSAIFPLIFMIIFRFSIVAAGLLNRFFSNCFFFAYQNNFSTLSFIRMPE